MPPALYTGNVADSSSIRTIPVFLLLGGSRRAAPCPCGAGGVRGKVWLHPVRLEWSCGFARNELRRIEAVVEENRELLVREWHEFFGN